MRHLPDYYANSPEMRSYQEGLSAAISDLWDAVERMVAQLCPGTATDGLRTWEDALGILDGAGRSLEDRRAAVIAKLRSRVTATAEMIRSVAAASYGANLQVEEIPEEYLILIWLLDPPDIPAARAVDRSMRKILPAHLRWRVRIRHHTWSEIEQLYPTFDDINGNTFLDLWAVEYGDPLE